MRSDEEESTWQLDLAPRQPGCLSTVLVARQWACPEPRWASARGREAPSVTDALVVQDRRRRLDTRGGSILTLEVRSVVRAS